MAKIVEATQIFEKHFNITPLLGGIQLSLKCKKDKRVVQVRPRKLLYYRDVPNLLCEDCHDIDSIKKYKKIKTTASKNKLSIISDRKYYFENMAMKLKCANGHEFTTDKPVKTCIICTKTSTLNLSLKINRKNISTDVLLDGYNVYLCIKHFSVKKVKEGLEALKKLKLKNKIIVSHKKIKELLDSSKITLFEQDTVEEAVEDTVEEAVEDIEDTVEEDIEDTVEEAVEDTVEEAVEDTVEEAVEDTVEEAVEDTVEEAVEDIEDTVEEAVEDIEDTVEEAVEDIEDTVEEAVEDTVEDSEVIVKVDLEHINDNIEKQEINHVFENPQKNNEDIDLEFNNKDILKAHNKHDDIMDNYYCKLYYKNSIINDKDYNKDDIINEDSRNEKNNNLEEIIYKNSPGLTKYIGNDITKKYLNHDSFKKYFKSLNIKNLNGFIFTSPKFIDIIDLASEVDALVKHENISFEEMKNSSEYFETQEEKKFCENLTKIVKKVYNIVDLFYKTKTLKPLKSLLNELKNYKEEDCGMFEMVIMDLLMSRTKSIEVDPVIIVTLILCVQNPHYGFFSTYYSENHEFIYSDMEFNTFIHHKGILYLCSKRFLQKFLYIDSGVARLFWKIVIADKNLEKFEINNDHSYLLKYCPDTMFSLDNKIRCGLSSNTNENKEIQSYLDYRYDFMEFLISVLDFPTFNYDTRSLLCRLLMLTNSHGSNYHIGVRIIDYLRKYMFKGLILNEEEFKVIENLGLIEAEEIIQDEIKNMFSLQILFEKKCKPLTTINTKYILKN